MLHNKNKMTLVLSSPVGSNTHDFTISFNPPLNLDNDEEYEVGLSKAYLWYSWRNISAANQNNQITISTITPPNTQTFTFPDGTYSLGDIDDFIEDAVIFTLNGSRGDVVFVGQNSTSKVRVEMGANYTMDFSTNANTQGLASLLGFTGAQQTAPITASTTGNSQANITNGVDSLLIHCSIVDASASYANNLASQILYSVSPPIVAPGSLFQATHDTNDTLYLPLNTNYIANIRMHITSQDGVTPVNLQGEQVTYYLYIKRVS